MMPGKSFASVTWCVPPRPLAVACEGAAVHSGDAARFRAVQAVVALGTRQGDARPEGEIEHATAVSSLGRWMVETVRNNGTLDWTMRENVRAKRRVLIKRVLR